MRENKINFKHYKVSIGFEGVSEVMIYANSVDEAEEIASSLPISIGEDNIEIERVFTIIDSRANTKEINPDEYSNCEKFYRSYFPMDYKTSNEKIKSKVKTL